MSEQSSRDAADKPKLASGFTWRSATGILYAAVVLQPAVIWLLLTTGMSLGWAAMYVTVLLFGELARMGGSPLSKQEVFTIMYGSTVSIGGGWVFEIFIYNVYFRSSPYAAAFGLTESIPSWVVPPLNSPAILQRTLLHSDWIMPILVLVVIGALLGQAVDLSLGFLTRQLYIETEKLPFPMQQVEAQVCLTMSERESAKLKVFTLSAIISMAYSVILWALPTITQAVGRPMVAIPIPWIDFSRWVGSVLPGASFGIATDLTVFALGLILPFDVVVSMFIGSFAFYVVGNAILVHLGLFVEWFPGMSLMKTWERSMVSFWMGPLIGLGVTAGVLPLVRHPGYITKAFTDLLKMPTAVKERGAAPLKLLLALFLFGTLGSVLCVWWLVPGFRQFTWMLILLSVGWTFLFTIISARAIGVTGMGLAVPFSGSLFATEGAYLASGYTGVDIWYAPLVVSGGGSWWCALFKVADLTETNPRNYVKAYIFALIISYVMGFIYVSAFWSISPMPSALFPCPTWPASAAQQTFFFTRAQLFQPSLLIGAGAVGTILFLIVEITHLPLSLIGIVAGATSAIPITTSFLIGAIAAKLLEREFGKEWFGAYRSVIVAGTYTGVGFTIGLSTAIALIARSMWAMPY